MKHRRDADVHGNLSTGKLSIHSRIGVRASYLLKLIQLAVVVIVDAGERRFEGGLVGV